jgi:outer membrane protein TolC
MNANSFLSPYIVIGAALAGVLVPVHAHALEPLPVFLEGAKTANFDARELEAVTSQRDWERESALGRLLPGLSARGAYTFNQFESSAPINGQVFVITPQNQLDGSFQLDVPVVDVASHHRLAQATHLKRASQEQEGLTRSQIESTVARTYFLLLSSASLVDSAERSLALARDSEKFIATRAEFGAATGLDVERARANTERARQDLADAVLARELAARQLETLTGIQPSPVDQFPDARLDPPEPLETWLADTNTPADRVQAELSQATVFGRKAAKSAFIPTLSVSANERFTNAAGFVGESAIFTLQAVLAVRLDYSTYATTKAQEAQVQAQTVRQERTRRTTADAIFEAYQRVLSGIVKCESTQAQAQAAHNAALLADERFRAGAATSLDVTQSQRDAFIADLARVRANLDLAYARVQLITVSGKPLAPALAEREKLPSRAPRTPTPSTSTATPAPASATPATATPAPATATATPAPATATPATTPAAPAPAKANAPTR